MKRSLEEMKRLLTEESAIAGSEDARVLAMKAQVACVLLKQESNEEGNQLLREIRDDWKALPEHPEYETAFHIYKVGNWLYECGSPELAEPILEDVWKVSQREWGACSEFSLMVAEVLRSTEVKLGNRERAIAVQQEIVSVYESIYGAESFRIFREEMRLVNVYRYLRCMKKVSKFSRTLRSLLSTMDGAGSSLGSDTGLFPPVATIEWSSGKSFSHNLGLIRLKTETIASRLSASVSL